MITLTTVSSLDKVFSHIGPKMEEKSGTMLKNERYHFQLAVHNDGNCICSFDLKVEGLEESEYSVRTVAEIPGSNGFDVPHDDYMIYGDNAAHLYPDLLQPFERGIMLHPRAYTAFWITVYSPKGLKVGRRDIKLTVSYGDVSVSTDYTLDVLDAELPENDFKYTSWMHYDGIAEYYGLEPFSKPYYEIFGTFLDSAVSHGMTVLYTPLFTPPLDTAVGHERKTVQLVDVKKTGKGYEFDFGKLDEFMDFALSKNIKYFEMSHLTTQWGAAACPKIMADTDEGYKRIFGWDTPSLGDEYVAFLHAFLPALDAFLKKKGVADKCFFHVSDEPSKEQYEHFKKVVGMISPLIKGYKTMDATGDPNNDCTDYPVIATYAYKPEMDARYWVYYCLHPFNNYFSNRFFDMPSARNRILGLQLYLNNANGFLHWGFNFYNTAYSLRSLNPFYETDGGGNFPSGDSFLVYPGRDGAWESIRHEVFYDGLQDRRALVALEKKIGREAVADMLKAEGMSGYNVYPRSAEFIKRFREKINKMLAK